MNRPKNIKLVIESLYNPELKLVLGDESYKALREKNKISRLHYDWGEYFVTKKAVYHKHYNHKSYHKIANIAIHPMIVTLIDRLHILMDELTEPDLTLIKALNDYIEPKNIKTETTFIQAMKEYLEVNASQETTNKYMHVMM